MTELASLLDEIARLIVAKVREQMATAHFSGPRVLTLDQAAEYLGCTPRHVQNLIAADWFQPIEWSSGARPKPYLDVRDLDAAIEKAKRKKTTLLTK